MGKGTAAESAPCFLEPLRTPMVCVLQLVSAAAGPLAERDPAARARRYRARVRRRRRPHLTGHKEAYMSLATAALGEVEKRLPKVIDARTHGIIDYCHAAFFFGMASSAPGKNRRAAKAALATGAFILAESLLTDYPLGREGDPLRGARPARCGFYRVLVHGPGLVWLFRLCRQPRCSKSTALWREWSWV